jgi:hypothetical protein
MSFAAITLCVASQRVFIIVVYFVIDSVRKILDTPSYMERAGKAQSTISFGTRRKRLSRLCSVRFTFKKRAPVSLYMQLFRPGLNEVVKRLKLQPSVQ